MFQQVCHQVCGLASQLPFQVGAERWLPRHHAGNGFQQSQIPHHGQHTTGVRLFNDVVNEQGCDGFPRHVQHLVCVALNRSGYVRGDTEPVPSDKLDQSEHSSRVVREHNVGILGAAHDPFAQVPQPAPGQVDNFGLGGPVCQVAHAPQQRVPGKLATRYVFPNGGRLNFGWLVPLATIISFAIRLFPSVGNLDDFILKIVTVQKPRSLDRDDGDPVLIGDVGRRRRDAADKLLCKPRRVSTKGDGIHNDVHVFDRTPEHKITNSPADHIDVFR